MASQTKTGPSLLPGAAGPAPPVPLASAPAGTRLWFLDHLRLVLICGVVVAHLTSIYAGGWYQYRDPVQADLLTINVLAILSMLAISFGLGFFFLIAGYFTPGSYDRKGAPSFLRDRLVRLLIPWLLYDLLLDPLVVYITGGRHGSYWSFYGPYLLHVQTIAPVIIWFIEVLLLFTLGYAAWRGLSRHQPQAAEKSWKLPSERAILGFIVALGLLSFVVRIWWPLNWWWQPFSLEVAHLPQYISFYLLGIIAYRRNWFAELSPRMGRDGWRIALVALLGFLLVAVLVMTFGGGAGMQRFDYYRGGFHWQALLEAMGEAFLVVGVCIGSLVLFRQRWNRQGRLAKSLAGSSYTIYLIHPLVIVSVALAFSTVALSPPAQIRHRGAPRAPTLLPGEPRDPQASIGQQDVVRGNARRPWKRCGKSRLPPSLFFQPIRPVRVPTHLVRFLVGDGMKP
jgi:glucans biosynthesis protein C